MWLDPADDDGNITWTRKLNQNIQPTGQVSGQELAAARA
jgi:hypothetical protein